MNRYDQNETSATPTSYPPGTQENSDGPYVMAPPPMGYPTKDGDNRVLLVFAAAGVWTFASDEKKKTIVSIYIFTM
ncbi:Hypothetical predicted protein [Olea europaea subsp. europaea]|uniref:Uncharacterized protein n=1 Tax=Olea europaea subsp. europaea TaxID=158383 RepID=A0A8S0PXD9_OLEEU|nr:Hypothetical predicted protein [Olea europaea subsp. europaea]